MALSILNKSFLCHLQKLDIDLKQFRDKTFDGLFDNVPNGMNHFFNWFIENVTPNNVLTNMEESAFFELEKNGVLPIDEEVRNTLSCTGDPNFMRLQNLDLTYIKTCLTDDLEDLTINYKTILEILKNTEFNSDKVKEKHNIVKEQINFWKKNLYGATENYFIINSSLENEVNNSKFYLLEVSNLELDSTVYKYVAEKENLILKNLEKSYILNKDASASNIVHKLFELEEDLINVETFLTLSRGMLIEKNKKIEALNELLEQYSFGENLDQVISFNFILSDTDNTTNKEKIKTLETNLCDRLKDVCQLKVKNIFKNYISEKIDLNSYCIERLISCKNFIKSNLLINIWLISLLSNMVKSLEKTKSLRKECFMKLNHYEANISTNVSKFNLKKQKVKEIYNKTQQNSDLLALKDFLSVENNVATLAEMLQLLCSSCDEPNFMSQKFQNELQLSIKSVLNDILYGPTNQILHVPVDILMKFQKCVQYDKDISQKIRHLVNKYLETKELVAKSDRKSLLLWVKFLTNPLALRELAETFHEA